jgi:hypothetical protein
LPLKLVIGVVAIVLIALNALVSRRYYSLHVAVHGSPADRRWFSGTDPDPKVDIWRRYRLITNVGVIVATALIALTLIMR